MCNWVNLGLSVRCCALWNCREDALSSSRENRPSVDISKTQMQNSMGASSGVFKARHRRDNPRNQLHRPNLTVGLPGKLFPVRNSPDRRDPLLVISLVKRASTLCTIEEAVDLANQSLKSKFIKKPCYDPSEKEFDKLLPFKNGTKLLCELESTLAQAFAFMEKRLRIIPFRSIDMFSCMFLMNVYVTGK